MGLYESNYIRLGWLAGDLRALAGRRVSCVPGDCELVLTVTGRSAYTADLCLTYLLPGRRGPLPFPDLALRIYHDAHLVEAQQWDAGHGETGAARTPAGAPVRTLAGAGAGARRNAPERELGQSWARNMMLNKWLEYCVERGHRFSAPGACPAGA